MPQVRSACFRSLSYVVATSNGVSRILIHAETKIACLHATSNRVKCLSFSRRPSAQLIRECLALIENYDMSEVDCYVWSSPSAQLLDLKLRFSRNYFSQAACFPPRLTSGSVKQYFFCEMFKLVSLLIRTGWRNLRCSERARKCGFRPAETRHQRKRRCFIARQGHVEGCKVRSRLLAFSSLCSVETYCVQQGPLFHVNGLNSVVRLEQDWANNGTLAVREGIL